MQKQSVPLKLKETAIVQTGLEKQIIKESSNVLISPYSCKIQKKPKKNYTILKKEFKIAKAKFTNQSKLNKLIKEINKPNLNKNFYKTNYKKRIYTWKIKKSSYSNEKTIETKNVLVKDKQWIKKGEIILDTNSTENGKICIGKNLLIGYIIWDGYNYEDAITINESLVENHILTSLHIKKYKTFIIKSEEVTVRKEI